MNRGGGQTVKNRTSSITNGVANSILNRWKKALYNKEIEKEMKRILEYDETTKLCVYCRKRHANTSDHVFPLIRDKRPTKYGPCSANMVPCCSVCNSSKAGRLLEEWPLGKSVIETEERWRVFVAWHKEHANTLIFADGDEERVMVIHELLVMTATNAHTQLEEISKRVTFSKPVAVVEERDSPATGGAGTSVEVPRSSVYWTYTNARLYALMKEHNIRGMSGKRKGLLVAKLYSAHPM